MFVPAVSLGILGASIATVTHDADPAKMVSAVFGGPMAVLVLLLVLHGPIATNILNVYSAALAALSMGIKLPRVVLALISGVAGLRLPSILYSLLPSQTLSTTGWPGCCFG